MGRPITTLFMLMSVDGKISTGATDELDFDQDFPRIEGCGRAFSSIMTLSKPPTCGR